MNFGTFKGFGGIFQRSFGKFCDFSLYLVQKKSDVLSWPTYQPTMSDFRPIMLDLPTYLKSDVINGRSQRGDPYKMSNIKFVQSF